ncbi:protein inscuteable homolog isoform X2 [Patella vulgata]|uniref:protein inscuteable homolog isoform X2 n=1 Tax=Patella vulgata TaxID=6465 RepID=UPI0021807EA5|nr:protein inscuteable homolog isoform X2 [Patella vulgata]
MAICIIQKATVYMNSKLVSGFYFKINFSRCKISDKMEFDSVQQWLFDLEDRTETECMSVLQGKPLHTDGRNNFKTTQSINWKGGIDDISKQAVSITQQFDLLFKCSDDERWEELHQLSGHVTCQIRTLIQSSHQAIPQSTLSILQQEQVIGECAKLAQKVESFNSRLCKMPLINQMTCLEQSFTHLIHLIITHLIKLMVKDLQVERNSAINLQNSMSSIISLSLEGENWCQLISHAGGVKSLLNVCVCESVKFAHVQSLRALSSICCLPEIIAELEKEGGLCVLLDILCDDLQPECVKGEAAGVLAQITSPAIEHNHFIGGLMDNLQDLVNSLMGLCCQTESQEIFLLSTAAVANLTFIDSMACEYLAGICAPDILVSSTSTYKSQSLFSKDQIATILANMAACDDFHLSITRPGGINLLIDFLHISPSLYDTETEIAACERVLQKAAIALTRLCREEKNAQEILRLKGVPRLVELCRNAEERCHSDAVLVASLAALRKVCMTCGNDSMATLDVKQLITPKLMDSFVMCSHSDENFV